MNTQNSQTAATPTAGTWFENLRTELLRVRRTQHLRLAELENVLIEIVTSDYVDDGLILQWAGQVAEAGLLTHQMIDNGLSIPRRCSSWPCPCRNWQGRLIRPYGKP